MNKFNKFIILAGLLLSFSATAAEIKELESLETISKQILGETTSTKTKKEKAKENVKKEVTKKENKEEVKEDCSTHIHKGENTNERGRYFPPLMFLMVNGSFFFFSKLCAIKGSNDS